MSESKSLILVADDNDAVRAVVAEILREHDYDVLEAGSGDEALALADGSLSLVIADIVMPPEGGVALVDELQHRIAGLKALFISGYGALPIGSASDPVLSKPFSSDELLTRVAQLLPGAAAAA